MMIVDEHRRGIALFRAFSRRRVMANVGAERLLKIAAELKLGLGRRVLARATA